MKKLKILHLITGSEGGGAERMLENIVNFSNHSHHHYIIVLKKGKKLNVKNLYQLNFSKNPIKLVSEFIRLCKIFTQIKPNIAISWLYHADLVLFVLAKLLKFPINKIVWNIRCSFIDLNDYSYFTRVVLFFLTKFSPKIRNVIFNSRAGFKYHKKIGYKNNYSTIIPNGFDINKFKFFHKQKKLLIKKLKLNPKHKIVAMFGRNDVTKNFKIFTNLAKDKSLNKNKSIKFLIAGKNTEKIKIEKKVKNLFIKLGYINNIHNYFNIVDVFVLISKGEGFPNVIGEAMSMNIPVICNDVGDNKIIVKNSGYILSKKPQIKEIIFYIKKCIKNSKKIKNGREIIKKNYEINYISSLYEQFFNKINKQTENLL